MFLDDIEYIFHKKWCLGRLKTEISWRSSKNTMGRFGGGWQWELGFQANRSTIIINLLILSVRISWYKTKI